MTVQYVTIAIVIMRRTTSGGCNKISHKYDGKTTTCLSYGTFFTYARYTRF